MGYQPHHSPSSFPPAIPAIDALRMLALWMIILRHAAYGFFMLTGSNTFLTIGGLNFYPAFVNGWFWFDMLFVLCGFQAARSWFHAPGQSYKAYALATLGQVAPLYYAAILISLSGLIPYYVPNGPVDGWSLLYHFLFLQDIFLPQINVFLATLVAEVKWALLVPFVLVACLRQKRPGVALAQAGIFFLLVGFCFRAYGFLHYTPYTGISSNIYSFFVSCRLAFVYVAEPVLLGVALAWLAHLHDRGGLTGFWGRMTQVQAARCVLVAAAIACAVAAVSFDYLDHITWFDALFQPWCTSLLMAGLVFGAVFGGLPGLVLRTLSARLYLAAFLIHIPLVQLAYFTTLPYIANPTLLFFAFTAVLLVATWIAAVGLHHLIEKPTLRLWGLMQRRAGEVS
jgi:peptidoglycan/LPS O-acetylase OafA/YrhL